MGSKRVMLQNGLGQLLRAESSSAGRVVDLFCGAASVAWFAATKLDRSVLAVDLQQYAAVLAGVVVHRTRPIDEQVVERRWLTPARNRRSKMWGWNDARDLDSAGLNTATWRNRAEELCASEVADKKSIIWRSYGGHYFSPTQALSFDAMLRSLPEKGQMRELCLAATIIAASRCAAAPGHTAQPFKATRTAAPFLREAWLRDPFECAQQAARELCPMHAINRGQAKVADANKVAQRLRENDVVFLDPPYSGVHYSRFYHVLETIARGQCGEVLGTGRYPPPKERPVSAFSRKGESVDAMRRLLSTLGWRGCTVVLTFPTEECSNGLSGKLVEEIAAESFEVTRKSVKTRFSTLGGNTANRAARRVSGELMLVLRPK